MKISNLKMVLTKEEKLTLEQLNTIKGGACGSPNDPRRCKNASKANVQKSAY